MGLQFQVTAGVSYMLFLCACVKYKYEKFLTCTSFESDQNHGVTAALTKNLQSNWGVLQHGIGET